MNRLLTGIDGFDEISKGGLVKNRTALLQGHAGTGKSTFAMQFLVAGIEKFDQNGLYLSLEYDPYFLKDDMANFNWDLDSYLNEDKLIIETFKGGVENPQDIKIDDLINFIFEETSKIDAKRVVIDSLNALEILLQPSINIRQELIRFNSLISDLDCTVILISEKSEQSQLFTYISDAVINLFYERVGSNRLRGIEIAKMRGAEHSSQTHSLLISSGQGIEVLPTEIDLHL
ncbi:MAG: hypothetical protein INQ03_19290 [Candidatus Heimdallarchaeota archaeon]|nr:hypothetical protein [Candidatus Heimdallarchaeota archaeon]